MPKELVGLVFVQANVLAYACNLGVGVYLVPSALALADRPEHRFALVVGKLCRHSAAHREATRPHRDLSLRTASSPGYSPPMRRAAPSFHPRHLQRSP